MMSRLVSLKSLGFQELHTMTYCIAVAGIELACLTDVAVQRLYDVIN